MPRVTNISAYEFAPLRELRELRAHLLDFCKSHDLKGTILIAPEGINLFVAGRHLAIEELVFELRTIPGLEHLQPKYSESQDQPFSRMLVRIKKEIIAFGVEGIDPVNRPAPRIKPEELKRWLDEGRPVVLYDTRNDYEVKLGTFKGALPAGIDRFRDFPAAVEKLPEEMKEAPVVTFCTGGIRCEKAAPFLQQSGFKEVYQLDGGILKYFEIVGNQHYEGECFVFDQRVGLDPALRESGSVVCFACQTPLTADEAEDPRYVEGESCPYCYVSDGARRESERVARQAALDEVIDPLPGSVPYDNFKPIRMPVTQAGKPLVEALDGLFPFFGRDSWLELIDQGRILGPDGEAAKVDRRVKDGEEYLRVLPGTLEPPVNAQITLIHQDEAMWAIDKPAPLPMHPSGRFHRNTLEFLLRQAWSPEVPRPAHRLDANTSGVVVGARTRHFAKLMQPQFARGEVEKRYLAKVYGHPPEDCFRIESKISASATELGAREIDADGQDACTEFRVLERFDDGTALLLVEPLTGRTHQIRIHLWESGHPIVGDPVYLPNRQRGDQPTLKPSDAPMQLHAWWIRLKHPLTGEKMRFTVPLPPWVPKDAASRNRLLSGDRLSSPASPTG
ncbi:RluA family pseudouridine synthase [Haloferula luteola]|uniref:tRNA uridine(34) hydroxylase n=1 Tax=Haloferula luteola TaxID=595692 RepID=A0A840V4N9_9BACT|nr:sulfurtransferase [Haloferula luteola]MBB5352985.1 RluA family pseudouridine synthase [Haloferula luteola]